MHDKLITAFSKSGPWALLSLVLILFYLYRVGPAIETITAQHNEMRAEDAASDAKVQAVMEQVLDAIRQNNYLMQLDCVNKVKISDREKCFLRGYP